MNPSPSGDATHQGHVPFFSVRVNDLDSCPTPYSRMQRYEDGTLYSARLLGADDCEAFRAMRLQSLQECSVFMPLIEDHSDKLPLEIESGWSMDEWRAFLRSDTRHFFGLFANGTLIGIGQLKQLNADTAELKSAFIISKYRGRKLWRLLMEARVHYAIQLNYKEVRIGYRIGNHSMERALAGSGFIEIRREQMKNKYQDGLYGHRVVLSMLLPVRS